MREKLKGWRKPTREEKIKRRAVATIIVGGRKGRETAKRGTNWRAGNQKDGERKPKIYEKKICENQKDHLTNVGKPNERLEKLRRNLKTGGWWWYTRTPAQPHVVTPCFPFFFPLSSSSLLFLPLPNSFFHFLFFFSIFLFFPPFSFLLPFHSFSLFHLFFFIFFHTFPIFHVFPIFSTLHVPPCSPLCYPFSLCFPFLYSVFNHYSLTTVFLSFHPFPNFSNLLSHFSPLPLPVHPVLSCSPPVLLFLKREESRSSGGMERPVEKISSLAANAGVQGAMGLDKKTETRCTRWLSRAT